jgi:nitroreductase
MSTIAAHPADTDAPILDVLAERWSTRIFDPETPIDEAGPRERARGRPLGAVGEQHAAVALRRRPPRHGRTRRSSTR